MAFRTKASLLLFFLIGLIIFFFIVFIFYSSASHQSLKSFLFGDQSSLKNPAADLNGVVSVKSFSVNHHQLWVIEMVGDKNSFDPSSLSVRESDVVDIHLSAIDRDYEIYLPDLGVYKLAPKGEKSEIQFQAYPAGNYVFACRNNCGDSPTASLVINK